MSKEEIVEPIKKKKWSYWGIGLLIFTAFFIGLMFLLEAVIQPRESLTATILAYVLGIVSLAVFAILVRDKGRVMLSVPILLIVVFGTGYLFNYVVAAPVYNPFAPISERTEPILETFAVLNETMPEMFTGEFSLENVEKYSQFAFVGDLALALPLFFFGTLGLTWVVQIFTTALKIATIFESIFAALFIILGLILTPLVHLMLAGVVTVGIDAVPGGILLADGFGTLFDQNATSTEIQQALDNLYNASLYFNQTAETLKSLQSAGLIRIAGIIPFLGSILTNVYWVSLALAQLTQGIGPFAEGLFMVMESIEGFGDVFNGSFSIKQAPDGSESVSINEINETAFDEAIDGIRAGIDVIGNSTDSLDDALESLDNVSIEDLAGNISKIPWMPDEAYVAIAAYAELASTYLQDIKDIIAGISILLSKPAGSSDATLVHFFLGWVNVLFAGTSIGEITAFNGTYENFDYAYGNFSIVDAELSTPEVQDIINRVGGNITIGKDFLSFAYDFTQVGIPFASLGLNLATGFTDMEGIIDIFETTDYQNVTNYQTILDDTSAINVTLTSIEADAIAVNDSATVVYDKAQIQGYGFLSDFAGGFAETMIQFDMISSIASTKYIANAMYYMVYSLRELSYTYGNITEGEENFTNLNFVAANNSFLAANESLNYAISNMTQSIFYMNQSVDAGMTQLESPRDTLIIIRDSLIDVNTELDTIFAILALPDPSTQAALFVTSVNNIFTILEDVNTELQTMSLS